MTPFLEAGKLRTSPLRPKQQALVFSSRNDSDHYSSPPPHHRDEDASVSVTISEPMHTDRDRQAGVNQSGRSHPSSKHDCLFEEERGGGSSTSRHLSITSLAALHQALPAPLLIPVCLPSDDELLDLQEEYGDRYLYQPGLPWGQFPTVLPQGTYLPTTRSLCIQIRP